MPFRHAFRMGASCVRLRPPAPHVHHSALLPRLHAVRPVFPPSPFYDPVETAVRTYLDADYETVMLEDNYRFRQVTFRGTELYDEADFTSSALFTPADVETLREQFCSSVIACFDYSESYSGQDFGIENAGAVGVQSYYSTTLTFFAELSEDTSYWDAHLLTDTDLSALGEDEIVITAYTFAGLQHGGLTGEGGEEIPLNDYDDIVGQKITIRGNTMDAKGELTVRGVLDLDLPDEFEAIEGNMDAKERSTLINERDALLAHGLYAAGFVSPGFYDAHSEAFLQRRTSVDLTEYFSFELSGGISVHAAGSEEPDSIRYISYLPIRYGKSPAFTLFDEGKDSLSDGEIALPFYLLRPQAQAMAEAERAAIAQREGEAAAQEFAEAMERDIDYLTDGSHLITESDEATGEIISRERVYADAEQLQAALDAVSALIGRYEETDNALCRTYSLQSRNGTALGDFRLAGFLYGKVSYEHDAAYFSEADCLSIAQSSELSSSLNSTEITAYSFPADARYRGCAVAVPTDTGKLRELLRAAGQVDEANDTFFTVGSPSPRSWRSSTPSSICWAMYFSRWASSWRCSRCCCWPTLSPYPSSIKSGRSASCAPRRAQRRRVQNFLFGIGDHRGNLLSPLYDRVLCHLCRTQCDAGRRAARLRLCIRPPLVAGDAGHCLGHIRRRDLPARVQHRQAQPRRKYPRTVNLYRPNADRKPPALRRFPGSISILNFVTHPAGPSPAEKAAPRICAGRHFFLL